MEIKGFFGSVSNGVSNFFKTSVTDDQVNKKLKMFDTAIESQKECEKELNRSHQEAMAKYEEILDHMKHDRVQNPTERKSGAMLRLFNKIKKSYKITSPESRGPSRQKYKKLK